MRGKRKGEREEERKRERRERERDGKRREITQRIIRTGWGDAGRAISRATSCRSNVARIGGHTTSFNKCVLIRAPVGNEDIYEGT